MEKIKEKCSQPVMAFRVGSTMKEVICACLDFEQATNGMSSMESQRHFQRAIVDQLKRASQGL